MLYTGVGNIVRFNALGGARHSSLLLLKTWNDLSYRHPSDTVKELHSFKCGLAVVCIIKPQADTPWLNQALFSSASDHNTLWGSLWEIQMSGWLKINRGSAETWVCLNLISPAYSPRRLVINPLRMERHELDRVVHKISEEPSKDPQAWWIFPFFSLSVFLYVDIEVVQLYTTISSMESRKAERGPCKILINSSCTETVFNNFGRWVWLERECKPDYLGNSTTLLLQQKPLFWRNVY